MIINRKFIIAVIVMFCSVHGQTTRKPKMRADAAVLRMGPPNREYFDVVFRPLDTESVKEEWVVGMRGDVE